MFQYSSAVTSTVAAHQGLPNPPFCPTPDVTPWEAAGRSPHGKAAPVANIRQLAATRSIEPRKDNDLAT